MVWEPLGYAGGLNLGGIIMQFIGFIMLLTQFQNWIQRVGKKIGDSEKEISSAEQLVTKGGIIFIIIGTGSQIVSILLTAYIPNFLSELR